ncbi:MAG: DPP IV N-terminal domain-containing protein [Bacteroidales bacterium]|nr:DPP IV N-terminal domain-containing protein [Bacteroidales bacterium]
MKAWLAATLLQLVANGVFSPDSTRQAFTRDGDLWMRDMADSTELRLTSDGGGGILNGYASWVYYEEIFGRASQYRAFWWSPDSRRLAFYRFDESRVPVFPIFSPAGQGGRLTLTRYPKAGQENPSVRIGFIDTEHPDAPVVWADFPETGEQYFGTPFWSADATRLFVPREPRRQQSLDLYAVRAEDGSKELVYQERSRTWVDWIEGMLFTEKGLYMARDFETGWQQVYFLGYDGSLKRLTEGENWDIHLLRTDEKRGALWFTAKRDSRLHPALYRLERNGRVTCLTNPAYWVRNVRFSADGRRFSAELSHARVPWQSVSGLSWGTRPISPDPRTGDLPDGPHPEPVRITHEGYDLYGLMSLPAGFEPTRRYPVVMQLYGGPGTPYVRDRWQDRDASDRWCWENGIIYIVVDPRSSGENGRRGLDEAYRRMTVAEREDYLAWARYLGSLPYVDASRIGVEGFSFGGTTTALLVLRYPDVFRCGIAGGGVYDWTLYDSHYTERFMDTPAENPDGYRQAGVLHQLSDIVPAAVNGRLKLTHGTGDDNVHFQNTLQLADSLQRRGVQFELMVYPDAMHGYRGAQKAHSDAADHLFWARHLLAE